MWLYYANHYGVAMISRLLKILHVSFAKEPYERDYILHKRHIIIRSLLIVATQYLHSRRRMGVRYLLIEKETLSLKENNI